MLKKCSPIENDEPEEISRVEIAYIDQEMPFAYGMSKHESITSIEA